MIHHLFLRVNPSGNIVMWASEDKPDQWEKITEIFNASSVPAAKLYKDFRSGKTITKKDVQNVKKEAEHRKTRRWKIVDMNIAPNDQGVSVLNITFELDGMRVSTSLWPPRTPSARRYLEAFQVGNVLYDEDFRELKSFSHMEAEHVGLHPSESYGVLEWNPEWNEYL